MLVKSPVLDSINVRSIPLSKEIDAMAFPGASYIHVEWYSYVSWSTLLYGGVDSRGSHHEENSAHCVSPSPFPLLADSPPKAPNCMISKEGHSLRQEKTVLQSSLCKNHTALPESSFQPLDKSEKF